MSCRTGLGIMEKPLWLKRLTISVISILPMTQTPENDIEQLRERIKELEHNDEIFARRSNTLLDEILITDERLDRISERLDRTAAQSQENTQAISQLNDQLEQLADRFDEMVNNQIGLQETVSQLTVFWTGLAHQAEADRAVMRQILEYLRNQYPGNGSGSSNPG